MHALLYLLHVAVTTLEMAGHAIVSTLCCLHVYDAIVARFVATEPESWISTMQSY